VIAVNDYGDSGRGSRREFINFIKTDVNLYMQDVAICPVFPQLTSVIASSWLMTIFD